MKSQIIPRLLLIVFFTLSVRLAGADGFMQVRNFSSDTYEGGPQNWTAVQDSIGRLYVGNRDGVLAFDGERWRKYVLPNSTTVRSLLFDNRTNRLYAGGSEEFGYFSPDSVSGEMVYTSLLPTLEDDRPHFTEVWNIIKVENKVWFQSDYHLFLYDGSHTKTIRADGRISCSALIDRSVCLALGDGSLLRYNGTRFVPIAGSHILSGKKIAGLTPGPLPGSILIATSVDGLFIHKAGSVTPFVTDINGFIKDNQLFCAVSKGSDYVFGTVTRGAVVKNFASGVTKYINKESGMQNNTVLGAGFDKAGNIWLCLDNGLDYAVYNSPVTNLIGPSNDVGAGYTSYKDGDKVYFGTNQGLYSARYPFIPSPAPVALTRELQGQVWSITPGGDGFFVASDAGVYHHTQAGFSKVEGLTGAYKVITLATVPGVALASTYDKFHCLREEGGRWRDCGPVEGDDAVSGFFVEDSHGYLWLNHWLKGVYRLHFNPATLTFDDCRLFNSDAGLPDNYNNAVAVYHGRVVLTNARGFYTFDYQADRAVPDKELNALFPAASPISLHALRDGSLVMIEKSGLHVAMLDANGDLRPEYKPLKSLADKLVNGFDHVNILGADELVVSNQDGFWSIGTDRDTDRSWEPMPFISAVYANGDSIVFRAGLSDAGDEGNVLTLPYDLNSLRFEFACPDFRSNSGVRYSSWLENYDDAPSPLTGESTREYTRLNEGCYTLHISTHNLQSGRMEETVFRFRISPPWYRSTGAKAMYFLIIAALTGLAYMTIRRWKLDAERQVERRKEEELEAVRRHAEQEALKKDYEIATLKSVQLEDDVRHRSQELSSTTMNLVRKNEILHDIAARVAKIQAIPGLETGTPGVQKQLARIQTAIEENISHDDDWKTFNRNFDIVYENFTKRLVERHPQLGAADRRLCCYIKMGLSSKEIAPLANISYKSVEMARYRLRKKMNLETEVSLTDYLDDL